ncbi:hypothetical protein C8R46DRAFT_1216235 [Mycena filopes]|nr:hypothetical protein C8R46DRAFT_1216235 [Mycena filopes]
MGRWTQYDEDSYRLPSDLVRVGYDADTGQYTFRDRNGTYFNGVPGSQYGPMFPVGSSGRVPTPQLVDELVLSPQKDKPRRQRDNCRCA